MRNMSFDVFFLIMLSLFFITNGILGLLQIGFLPDEAVFMLFFLACVMFMMIVFYLTQQKRGKG